jgi:hypothetical protein
MPPLPPIQAGELRHFCAVEAFVKTSAGDRGQPLGSWTVLYPRVPCQITPLTGRLLEITRQLVGTATHQVRIRWRPGMLPGQRLRVVVPGQYFGRVFGVGHVGDGDGRKYDQVLAVTEQQTGAT